MDITVEELSTVDKEIRISATREDLASKFDQAFRKYQNRINIPGFRPGKVPLEIVRKRFGKEIEYEEINKYIQEIFEKEVIPAYEPIGETQMLGMNWENDELQAKFKIGSRPNLEITDLGMVKVDKLVHDVTDQEVDEDIERALEREGDWEEVEEAVTEKTRVTVDAVHLDEEGNPTEGETDKDQVIDMRREEFKAFSDKLLGKKIGDIVDVEVGGEDQKDTFRLIVKKVQKVKKAELTDEFAKKQTNEEANNVDEYKSLIKSRIQNYYDQSAADLFKSDVVDALVDAHSFDVPEVFIEQIQNHYIERLSEQNKGELPAGFDVDEYKMNMKDHAVRDAKWFFINEKLQEKFDDIEIKPDDIDEYLEAEAARYGITFDQMRNLFAQNPRQLESLRNSILEDKVFEKLGEEVRVNEISKDEYRQQHEKKIEEHEKSENQKEKRKFWNIFS